MNSTPSGRIQPLRALRALGRILRDPNDTEQVFEILGAMGGRAIRRRVKVLRKTEEGRSLLDAQPELLHALHGTTAEDFAPGTLGWAYHEFLLREGITTDGLVAVSDASTENLSDDTLYLSERMTQSHDLWHVVAGYQGDIVGEAALLAFTYAQVRNPGILLLVGALYVMAAGKLGARRVIREAYRRGKRARDIVGVHWEDELHRPLAEVRERHGVDEPPKYRPIRAENLGPRGLLGPVPAA